MALTRTQAQMLNNDNSPPAQQAKLGDAVYAAPVAFEYAITSAANAEDQVAFVAPFAMRIVDIIVRATATSGSGTVEPKKGTTAMCTAIDCAADGAVTHMSAGAVAAALALAEGDVVNVETNGAGDRGVVAFIGVRL